jgi:hypothetical protein
LVKFTTQTLSFLLGKFYITSSIFFFAMDLFRLLFLLRIVAVVFSSLGLLSSHLSFSFVGIKLFTEFLWNPFFFLGKSSEAPLFYFLFNWSNSYLFIFFAKLEIEHAMGRALASLLILVIWVFILSSYLI